MSIVKKVAVTALAAVICTSSVIAAAGCGGPKEPAGNTYPFPPESGTYYKIPGSTEEYYVPETLDITEQLTEMKEHTGKTWELDSMSSSDMGDKANTNYQNVEFYTLNKIVYCTKPTHPDEQSMLFYVPKAYLNEDGTINEEAEINGYTAKTAPIIYLNNFSGYNGGAPWDITNRARYAGVNNNYNNGFYLNYLQKGFVLVFVGERGKSSLDPNTNGVIGVAPYSVADLKAGIRFLKYNNDNIPGDAEKIISNGVSAGGAASALLGTTGNDAAYETYIEEMGGYVGTNADDSVFATQAYCPITDLDHAALAYEWMWPITSATNEFQNALTSEMAKAYAAYINTLNLEDGNGTALTADVSATKGGTFYNWLINQFEIAFEHYVDVTGDASDADTWSWLSYDTDTKSATITDLDSLVSEQVNNKSYMTRMKAALSFDPLNKSGDNAVFGIYGAKYESSTSTKHFTPLMIDCLDAIKDEFPTEYNQYYASYNPDVTNEDILKRIDLYNPYRYIANENTDKSEYFRVCVGSQDSNTSFTVSAIFALLLQNAGYPTEFNVMWNQEHYDCDYENEFEAWVDSICKQA